MNGPKSKHPRQALFEELVSIGRISGEPAFPQQALVGTFHKTGTVLIKSILRQFGLLYGTPFVDLANDGLPDIDTPWDVAVEHHSKFEEYGLDPAQFPSVVLIRDPRDIIVSSVKYHLSSSERWLHVAKEKFGGLTYQEKLNSLETNEERYLFELQQSAGRGIQGMIDLKDNPAHQETLFLKLEDLMTDKTLSVYHQFFNHLGLNPAFLPLALAVAYDRSIFSAGFQKPAHITSGKTGVWHDVLPQSVVEEFNRLYPDAPAKLGYPA